MAAKYILAALSVVRHVVIFGTALAGSWTLIVGALAMRGDEAARHATSAGERPSRRRRGREREGGQRDRSARPAPSPRPEFVAPTAAADVAASEQPRRRRRRGRRGGRRRSGRRDGDGESQPPVQPED
jgi:hypothetical protein